MNKFKTTLFFVLVFCHGSLYADPATIGLSVAKFAFDYAVNSNDQGKALANFMEMQRRSNEQILSGIADINRGLSDILTSVNDLQNTVERIVPEQSLRDLLAKIIAEGEGVIETTNAYTPPETLAQRILSMWERRRYINKLKKHYENTQEYRRQLTAYARQANVSPTTSIGLATAQLNEIYIWLLLSDLGDYIPAYELAEGLKNYRKIYDELLDVGVPYSLTNKKNDLINDRNEKLTSAANTTVGKISKNKPGTYQYFCAKMSSVGKMKVVDNSGVDRKKQEDTLIHYGAAFWSFTITNDQLEPNDIATISDLQAVDIVSFPKFDIKYSERHEAFDYSYYYYYYRNRIRNVEREDGPTVTGYKWPPNAPQSESACLNVTGGLPNNPTKKLRRDKLLEKAVAGFSPSGIYKQQWNDYGDYNELLNRINLVAVEIALVESAINIIERAANDADKSMKILLATESS